MISPQFRVLGMTLWRSNCSSQLHSLVMRQCVPKEAGVLQIKTLKFVHFVGVICNIHITMNGAQKKKAKLFPFVPTSPKLV